MDSLELFEKIKTSLEDSLGENIICIDVRNFSSLTDFLVIVTGKADSHVRSIAEKLISTMKKEIKTQPYAVEGMIYGRWVCVDYVGVIVHIMLEEEREIYDLRSIWGEAPLV